MGESPLKAESVKLKHVISIYLKVSYLVDDRRQSTDACRSEAAHPYYEVKPHYDVVFASIKGGKAPLDPTSVEGFKDDEGCKVSASRS